MSETTASSLNKRTGTRKCGPCQRIPNGRCAPPASPIIREQNAVMLTINEIQPSLSQRPTGTLVQLHRGCNRFGVPSQSAFFNRNNPQTQRVRHIKGIHGQPVCCVNDLVLGRQAAMCLGRPLTPEISLILCGKIPTSAIGTNSTALPINTLTGLQFFPLKQIDTPTLKLLTDAWRGELTDLIERVGLLVPSKDSRGTSPYRSPLLGGNMEEDTGSRLELMLVDILCQVLEVKSIREVQMWLLTAGQREKDHIVSLLCSALEKHQPQTSVSDTTATEKLAVKQVPGAIMMTPVDEDESQTCRDQSPAALNRAHTDYVTSPEEIKQVSPVVTQGTWSTSRPLSGERKLSSPAVCHLLSPQKPVLRYTKRAITPQTSAAGSLFQEQWSNYNQSPVT